MEDKNVASNTELKLEKKNGKVKKEWTVKKVLTTIIIAILALLMIGGSFYYILSPGFSKKSQAFGFYDGEPVLYENNSMFARTLMADENYQTAAASGDYTTVYSSWYKAYQTQVAFIALSKMAKEAKIIAPQELVNKMIINSGSFNNENGEFDAELYNSTSEVDKRYFYNYMKSVYPFQQVVSDVATALTSANELSFVKAIGSNSRTFEYFVVGANAYPDYLAKQYANEHADYFKKIDLSMISCASEDDAKKCLEEMKAGLSWDDAVAKYSGDSYASANGSIGYETYVGIIGTNMKDSANISKLANLKADEYTDAIEGPYAWVIYKANSDVKSADLTDQTTVNEVKSIIYQNDKAVMQNYVDEAVAKATEAARDDFDNAAYVYGTGIATVGPTTNNVGSSSVIAGISDYDSNGILNEAVTADAGLNTSLFNEPVDFVAGPIEVEEGYLFVRVSAMSYEESLGNITETMYKYYANQFSVVDLENGLVSSDKHEDKFTEKFLNMFFGSTN